MSEPVISPLLARLRLGLEPTLPVLATVAAALLRRLGQAGLVVLRLDWIGLLIRAADAVEHGLAGAARLVRQLCRNRLVGLGGNLAWRGLAALTGIGLATWLAASVSGGTEDTMLAGAIVEEPAARPLRDVRLEPRPATAGESWIRIPRPVPMFGLDSPEFDGLPARIEAFQSGDGRQRQDRLDVGGFEEPGPHLHLRLQPDHEGAGAALQPFVIGLVREAAGRGLSVRRSSLATGLPTRFGSVETADVTLAGDSEGRACIAFRKQADGVPLALSGWWCGTAARPADRQQLTCLIDRIDLRSAGEDLVLRAAFARTELKRSAACAPTRLSAAGRKTSWLDPAGSAPPLRTRTAVATERHSAPRR